MHKFQTIYAITEFECGQLKPIKLKLLANSKILKIEYDRTDYKNICHLSILVQINIDQIKDQSEYTLGIFTDQEKVSNSYFYINSFKDKTNSEYHVCLLKE